MDEAEEARPVHHYVGTVDGYGKGHTGCTMSNRTTPRSTARSLGKRFARFKNLMWMHAGDRNPDANLLDARASGREIQPPRRITCTVHNSPEFASARFHHEDAWLDVNLGYTSGASYLHILRSTSAAIRCAR